MSSGKTIFISRAGPDAAFGIKLADILRASGHPVVIQDENFGYTNFMAKMDRALAESIKVVALLSPAYLQSDYCRAEALAALAHDPLNSRERLLLLRIADCRPDGVLAPIAFCDLLPVSHDESELGDVVGAALQGQRKAVVWAHLWHEPRVLLDLEDIHGVPSFTGREDGLKLLDAALWGSATSIAPPAVIYGGGGTGKSALARQYAWLNRDRYGAICWLNAEMEHGVIDGLVEFGTKLRPALKAVRDPREAAKTVVSDLLPAFEKPTLLIFDNLVDESLIVAWRPESGCHALVTTRQSTWNGDVRTVPIAIWKRGESIAYFLHQSGRSDILNDDADAIAEMLGDLPLALSHAAAFLRWNRVMTAPSFVERIERYLAEPPKHAEYPNAVYATFQAALRQAEAEASGAASILSMAAFYAPDEIPLELFERKPDVYSETLFLMFKDGAKGQGLRAAIADIVRREDAIGALHRLSIIAYHSERRTFSVHRLVQAATRDLLETAKSEWIAAGVRAAENAFPNSDVKTWPLCTRLARHIEAIGDHAPDELGISLAELLGRTGYFLGEMAEFVRAVKLNERALAVAEKAAGPNDPALARSCNYLALLFRKMARLPEAEQLYRRALRICEAASDLPSAAICLSSLADLLGASGRFAEAEPLARRALEVAETTYGPDHPDVGSYLNNLASLLRNTDRLAEAEPLFRRALTIGETSEGPNHPIVAMRLSNLAVLLQDTNRPAEAEPLLGRALMIDETNYGPDHPDVASDLNNLAALLSNMNRLAEAEPLLQRALRIDEASRGLNHPNVATRLNNLAVLLQKSGRLADAEPLLRRALKITEDAYGKGHQGVALRLWNLASLLQATDRVAEAIPFMERAAMIYRTEGHADAKPAQEAVLIWRLELAAGGRQALQLLLQREDTARIHELLERSLEMLPSSLAEREDQT